MAELMTRDEQSPLNAIRYAIESFEEFGDAEAAINFLRDWEVNDLAAQQHYRDWCKENFGPEDGPHV